MLEVRVNKQWDQNIERKERRDEKLVERKTLKIAEQKVYSRKYCISSVHFTLDVTKYDNHCVFSLMKLLSITWILQIV